MKNKVLIVSGMHRSMTSLCMQWLDACGLPVGDDLYGPTKGNKKGHYEDKDFLEINRYILSTNGYSWNDHNIRNLLLSDYIECRAKKIVELKNDLYRQWGWKDPRTCITLDFWDKIITDCKYLIIYRSYHEVVDSLLRRDLKAENKIDYLKEGYKKLLKLKKLKQSKASHLKLWISYNKKIIQGLKKIDPERYLIINNNSLLEASEDILDHLTMYWGFDLKKVPMKEKFDPKLKKSPFFSLSGVDANLLLEAESIWNQLHGYSTKLQKK